MMDDTVKEISMDELLRIMSGMDDGTDLVVWLSGKEEGDGN